jgi:hypothetical protein
MAAGGHTSGDSVAGVTIAFTVVSVVGTLLRLYTRFILNGMAGPDDIVIAIATVRRNITTSTIKTDSLYRHWQWDSQPRCASKVRRQARDFRTVQGHLLTSDSHIRHWSSPKHTHRTRSHLGREMVLGKPLGLLLGPLLRQVGHLTAVSAHLPAEDL